MGLQTSAKGVISSHVTTFSEEHMHYRRTKRAFPSVEAWQDATGTDQQTLAKLVGISRSHLCNILGGKRRASLDVTLRLAKTTNVPIEVVAGIARVA